jgi:hypothetical protein
MSWWGALFSSKRIVDEGMDTIKDMRSGIDMLVFTSEEKALMNVEISNIVLKRAELALQESSIKSMTRRILAVSVVLTAELLTVILAVGYLGGLQAQKMEGIWTLLKFWSTPLAIVLAFYLGYYGLTQIAAAKK